MIRLELSRAVDHLGRAALAVALSTMAACDTGAEDDTAPADTEAPDDGTEGGSEAAVYGIGSLVTQVSGSNAYLRLVDDLGFEDAEVSLDEAREFAGSADMVAFDGAVLVASGDAPTVTRYAVADDMTLQSEGEVSFANFGVASAAFWNQQFVAEDKAYLTSGSAELVIWDPQAMTIGGTIELPEIEEREGLVLRPGLVDRASAVHEGKYYVPLYWTDENYALRSDDSIIVVVDVATDRVETTLSAPCPGLDYATVDDDGMLHFSNWTGGVGTYWVLGTAQNCIATVDPRTNEVTTRTFASIADGHEGAAFRYAGDGHFVMSIFDEVRADVESADEPFGIVGAPNWQLWDYDPATNEAAPIEAVEWNSGAIIHNLVGGDFYSMVPGADYATTVVYRRTAPAQAESAFGIEGWSFRLFQVR